MWQSASLGLAWHQSLTKRGANRCISLDAIDRLRRLSMRACWRPYCRLLTRYTAKNWRHALVARRPNAFGADSITSTSGMYAVISSNIARKCSRGSLVEHNCAQVIQVRCALRCFGIAGEHDRWEFCKPDGQSASF